MLGGEVRKQDRAERLLSVEGGVDGLHVGLRIQPGGVQKSTQLRIVGLAQAVGQRLAPQLFEVAKGRFDIDHAHVAGRFWQQRCRPARLGRNLVGHAYVGLAPGEAQGADDNEKSEQRRSVVKHGGTGVRMVGPEPGTTLLFCSLVPTPARAP